MHIQGKLTKLTFASVVACLALLVSGCIPSGGGGEKTAAQLGIGGAAPAPGAGGAIVPLGLTAVDAFSRTLRGEIQSRSCKTCHNSATLATAPLLADNDTAAAWNALSSASKVNLLSPSSSALVAKMQAQHNCGTGTECTAAASAFTNAINNMSVLMQAPPAPGGTPSPAPGGGTTTIPGLSSVAAFQQSLWPVLRNAPANCTNCHGDAGPRAAYAATNINTAHDSVVGGGLVNLTDVSKAGQAAIVLKIAAGHQGNPTALAATMQSAIVNWIALMQPTVIVNPGAGDPLATREVSAQLSMPADPANKFYIEGEAGTLTGYTAQGNALASAAMGISSPANNNVTMADPNASTLRAVYNFNIPTVGNYRIWARTLALTANDNELYSRNDATAFGTRTVTTSDMFTWNILQTVNFTTTGAHTFEVRMREDGLFLDKILVTSDMTFTPYAQGSRTLEFNVGQLAGLANVLFRIDVAEFDQFSYIFTNPRLVVPAGSSVVVKNVMMHVNGVYKAGDATFTVIDDEADAANGNLDNAGMLAGYGLIVLKGANPAMDKFTVSFGMIQVR